MILVDTSVWIDHFRRGEPALVLALAEYNVAQHPMVTAELALGSLSQRGAVLEALTHLPQVTPFAQADLLAFIEAQSLYATGIGVIDTHLLLSVHQNADLLLWTRDKRLQQQAERLGLRLYSP